MHVIRAKLMRMFAAGARYVIMIDPYRAEVWTHGDAPAGFDLDFQPLLR